VTTLRIAEVAERTGVPATTLRYYEDIGLLSPAPRSGNGYRAYSERDVERIRFLTRARRLDLGLDDLRDLVAAWDHDDCAGVQDRMADVVTARLHETQSRVADLIALTAQLQEAAERLASPPHPGPCHDGCACSAAGAAGAPTRASRGVPLTPQPQSTQIACSLEPDAVPNRMSGWQAVVAQASGREAIPGGSALTFPRDAELTGQLARLAVAEQICCPFFDFTIAVTTDGVRLEVRAPEEAHDVLVAAFGPTG